MHQAGVSPYPDIPCVGWFAPEHLSPRKPDEHSPRRSFAGEMGLSIFLYSDETRRRREYFKIWLSGGPSDSGSDGCNSFLHRRNRDNPFQSTRRGRLQESTGSVKLREK